MIYPTGDCKAYDLYLSLFLHPVDWTESLDTGYSFTVTSQTDPSMRLKRELKYNNFPGKWPGDGWSRFMLLSELHDPDKGYIVNHTCVITVEVTCMMNKETKDDDDLNEGSPNKVEKTENETQAKGKEEKSSSEAEEERKKGISGMQKVKTGLLDLGHPLRAAKLKMKAAGDELKKAEVQMMAAKDYLRDSISGTEVLVAQYLSLWPNNFSSEDVTGPQKFSPVYMSLPPLVHESFSRDPLLSKTFLELEPTWVPHRGEKVG
ncbi:hypothetical protein C5167_000207 [Papaver somniferum]|uniref:MATH domain-containing protein n=1 Tax=Papaver somniferum TaxID=3469 RepID=A0A4Y7KUF7_PAPSO|nr:hypothetical protein C5167_000207 [Papaver somniferum]